MQEELDVSMKGFLSAADNGKLLEDMKMPLMTKSSKIQPGQDLQHIASYSLWFLVYPQGSSLDKHCVEIRHGLMSFLFI